MNRPISWLTASPYQGCLSVLVMPYKIHTRPLGGNQLNCEWEGGKPAVPVYRLYETTETCEYKLEHQTAP